MTAAAVFSPHPAAAPLLSARRLAKAYGETRALRDASFDIQAGAIEAVIGENGSGKSTLVKILSGVAQPDAGTIAFTGQGGRRLASPR